MASDKVILVLHFFFLVLHKHTIFTIVILYGKRVIIFTVIIKLWFADFLYEFFYYLSRYNYNKKIVKNIVVSLYPPTKYRGLAN